MKNNGIDGFVNFVTGSAETSKHLAGKHDQDNHGDRAGANATPEQLSARKRVAAGRSDPDLGIRQSPGGPTSSAGLTVRQQRRSLFDNPNQDAAEVTLVDKKTGVEETMTVRQARRKLFDIENQDESSPYDIPGLSGAPHRKQNPPIGDYEKTNIRNSMRADSIARRYQAKLKPRASDAKATWSEASGEFGETLEILNNIHETIAGKRWPQTGWDKAKTAPEGLRIAKSHIASRLSEIRDWMRKNRKSDYSEYIVNQFDNLDQMWSGGEG